jgi:hypothetical protein
MEGLVGGEGGWDETGPVAGAVGFLHLDCACAATPRLQTLVARRGPRSAWRRSCRSAVVSDEFQEKELRKSRAAATAAVFSADDGSLPRKRESGRGAVTTGFTTDMARSPCSGPSGMRRKRESGRGAVVGAVEADAKRGGGGGEVRWSPGRRTQPEPGSLGKAGRGAPYRFACDRRWRVRQVEVGRGGGGRA